MAWTFRACFAASSLFLARGSCAGGSSVQTRREAFEDYVKQFQREYLPGTAEWEERRGLFEASLDKVEQHNCANKNLWHAVINKHSDRRQSELKSLRGWKRTSMPASVEGAVQLIEDVHDFTSMGPSVSMDAQNEANLPDNVDYKHLPAMKEILDQGMCGSCWAFASSVTLRANYQLWQGVDRTFSPQEIVSCTPNKRHCGGTGGCDGATAELAMEYVKTNGCRTSDEMGYEASDVACPGPSFTGKKGHATNNLNMIGWKTLPSNQAYPLKKALAEQGPVAVSVAASDAWFMYGGGVMDNCDKSDPVVNHAVVLVGYGASNGVNYWEIQNSWGVSWGDQGFLKLKRDSNEEKDYCGWDTKPQDGVACADDKEPKVWVCGMCGILYDSVIPLFANATDAGSKGNLRSAKKH